MAELRFNLLGYSFQAGLTHLRDSFSAAAGALARDVAAAHDVLRVYRESADDIGEEVVEEDDDGTPILFRSQLLEWDIGAAEAAAMELRKAYALALYHHWERAARAWTKLSRRADHDKLAEGTLAQGYPIHDRLVVLRDLANTLKHNKASAAAQLKISWPEVLPDHRAVSGRFGDWYDAVVLTDQDIRAMIDVVSRSGPTADTLPRARDTDH